MSGVNPGDTIRVGHTQFTLLPSAATAPRHHLVVHAIGFSTGAALDRQKLAAIYKKNKVLSPAMKQFISIIKEGGKP